jgi:iron complex outermembrane receptor protein
MLEINYRSRQQQFTQELRLQSNDSTAALNWVVGAYFMDERVKDNTRQDTLRDARPLFITPDNPTGLSPADSVAVFGWPYTQKTKGYAVFGQADYKLTDKLTGTVGLRWSADGKHMNYQSQIEDGLIVLLTSDQSKTFSALSGRLGLRYEVTPDASVYATYNRGYKSGGFFGGLATTPEEVEPYDNETLDAYEAGVKSEFFDRRLRLNVSGFYYDYKNQQVFAQALRNGLTVLVLDNAANSKVYGGEAEITARPTPAPDPDRRPLAAARQVRDLFQRRPGLQRQPLPQSPKVTFNAAATYVAPLPSGGAIVANVDANYASKVYFDNSNAERLSQDAVWVAGAQAQLALAGPGRSRPAPSPATCSTSLMSSRSPISTAWARTFSA